MSQAGEIGKVGKMDKMSEIGGVSDISRARMVPWTHTEPPTEEAIRRIYAEAGLKPSVWSNGPGERYSPHRHTSHKVLYCVRGSITFGLSTGSLAVTLRPGDRLDLPPNTQHDATVGPEGVTCLEAHLPGEADDALRA